MPTKTTMKPPEGMRYRPPSRRQANDTGRRRLSAEEIAAELADLKGWRLAEDGVADELARLNVAAE
jgi:hypothetical protein